MLLSLALLVLSAAQADDTPPTPAPPTAADEAPDDELDVVRTPAAEQARWRITRELRAQGYRPFRQTGRWTVYRSDTSWKPRVWIHADGWADIRRAPPELLSPARMATRGAALTRAQLLAASNFAPTEDDGRSLAEGNGTGLLCLQGVLCVGSGSTFVGAAKFAAQEEALLTATRSGVDDLREAVAAAALERRVNRELPDQLTALWFDDTTPAPDRRAALLALYLSRTDTPAGQAARDAIRAFVIAVVQPSGEGFSGTDLAQLGG